MITLIRPSLRGAATTVRESIAENTIRHIKDRKKNRFIRR
jgi:hypothetical protein